jgi:hypothetical protein
MLAHEKAMLALEVGLKRASAFKARLKAAEATSETDAWFREHDMSDTGIVFDQCMSGHVTMPEQMAWPVRYDPWNGIDWNRWQDEQWTYDRSMRLYVRS